MLAGGTSSGASINSLLHFWSAFLTMGFPKHILRRFAKVPLTSPAINHQPSQFGSSLSPVWKLETLWLQHYSTIMKNKKTETWPFVYIWGMSGRSGNLFIFSFRFRLKYYDFPKWVWNLPIFPTLTVRKFIITTSLMSTCFLAFYRW